MVNSPKPPFLVHTNSTTATGGQGKVVNNNASLLPHLPSPPHPALHLNVRDDTLGKLVRHAHASYVNSPSWEAFVRSQRAPPDIPASIQDIPHPAKHLLRHLRVHGAPAIMQSPPWPTHRRLEALRRGPHKSARDYLSFVREEFVDFLEKRFWTILPYHAVSHLRNLRLSPLGVVPQRDRRPRLIVDLSFYDVNQETVPLAPAEAMQFGRALQRILQRILSADPRFGPVYLAKIDIADGFYRIQVAPRDVPHLGVLLPTHPDEDALVAFPMVLPMGWVNSPPYFSASTETAADLMNASLRSPQDLQLPAHRLEEDALAGTVPADLPPVPPRYRPFKARRPLAHTDVYVDDFVALAQGSQERRRYVTRVLLHTLDQVFRPLSDTDSEHRQEPASLKKLRKGDAAWSTKKTVLGWVVDTLSGTIALPPHREDRLRSVLASFARPRKRAGVQAWQQLLGELRSMVLAIPGSRGLFSTLQSAQKIGTHGRPTRIRLTNAVHQFLDDFRVLAESLAERPTRLAEVVPTAPCIIGTTDASGTGMGGAAFLSTEEGTLPVIWRHRFPTHIQDRLVTWENPTGSISNSDLELAATVVHHDVLANVADVAESTIHTFHDNLNAMYWQRSAMANAPREAARDFARDLSLSQDTVRRGVVLGTQQRQNRHWVLWRAYCDELCIDPLLQEAPDPIPFLQVFATRYRRRPGPTGKPVRAGTVADALRSVGQTMASVGAKDSRLDQTGHIDFRLARMLKAYAREDDPPNRVKPIPVSLIRYLSDTVLPNDVADLAITDMIIIGFFFLLRPGEYTGTTNDDTPFRLQDVQLFLAGRRIDLLTAPPEELLAATSISLTFTTQKNGVRGEVITHGLSGHPRMCPVLATARRVLHLRTHNATPDTILASYYVANRLRKVSAKDVTSALRGAATLIGPAYGYLPGDVSARSLRAGGAMALFNSEVDRDTIRLLGRWQSDAMLRYLHLQAQPVMRGFARQMLLGGDYAFNPGPNVPA